MRKKIIPITEFKLNLFSRKGKAIIKREAFRGFSDNFYKWEGAKVAEAEKYFNKKGDTIVMIRHEIKDNKTKKWRRI